MLVILGYLKFIEFILLMVLIEWIIGSLVFVFFWLLRVEKVWFLVEEYFIKIVNIILFCNKSVKYFFFI